jgi:hypothetical protein
MEEEFASPKENNIKDPTTDDIAEKLAARVIKGRQILQKSEKLIIDSLLIDGKNLKQWAKELPIERPHTDDLPALEQASTDVAMAIQKAEYVLAVFELQASTASNFHDEGFAQQYVIEMEGNGEKKIAAEKIRQIVLVNSMVDSSLAASQSAKVIAEYFKRLVKGLEEVRKGLENRTRLLGLRMKFLQDHS